MKKKMVFVLAFFVFGGVMSSFAQSNTCTKVWSDGIYEVWRDDNYGEVWVEGPGVFFAMNIIRTVRGGYEVACSNGVRKVVSTLRDVIAILNEFDINIPGQGALKIYESVCRIGDRL